MASINAKKSRETPKYCKTLNYSDNAENKIEDMHRCFTKGTRRLSLYQKLKSCFLYLVTCSFVISLFWMQLVYSPANDTENLVQEALENAAKDARYSEVYRKLSKLPKDTKYILLWTEYDYAPFSFFEEGQSSFIMNNCSAINCYVTSNRKLFNDDITRFDAIAFNGRTMSARSLPKKRSPHQKYIFFNIESADNEPICDYQFDGFFNWTATYKLDSDILFPYIVIKNKQGEIVGPQTKMRWPQTFPNVSVNLSARLLNKTKAAAWFVSHCSSRSGRDQFVKKLQKALLVYGLVVDVYGSCGTLKCPKPQWNYCNTMLERDYFFYMSLENSFSEDYATEKLLTALQHNTVPIVYGGADYSRFLPPGSYLDTKRYNVSELAATMDFLIKNPKMYSLFFRWQSQYSYSHPGRKENICAVCAALNNKEKLKTSVHDQFRKWWNPNYANFC